VTPTLTLTEPAEAIDRRLHAAAAAQVAERPDSFVQNEASDGFTVGSHLTLTGLDEFVDRVVPPIKERGSQLTEHDGTALRANLRIPAPGTESCLTGDGPHACHAMRPVRCPQVLSVVGPCPLILDT
jgi:hypothetical protein